MFPLDKKLNKEKHFYKNIFLIFVVRQQTPYLKKFQKLLKTGFLEKKVALTAMILQTVQK